MLSLRHKDETISERGGIMYKTITINRMYGSNGRRIGKALAERLGIRYYDKELLKIIENRKDIPYEELVKVDEKRSTGWIYPIREALQLDPEYRVEPMSDRVFCGQAEIIREIAATSDSVIIGRCSNDLLRNTPGVRRVFIYAPKDYRIDVVEKRSGIGKKEATALVKKMDKQRRYYYNYFTDGSWDDLRAYDLCIDSSRFSSKEIVELLMQLYKGIEE